MGAVIAQRQGTDSCRDGGKGFTHSGTYQALARQSTGEKKFYLGARRQAPARLHKSCVYFCIRAGVGGMHDGFGWTGQGALGGLGWNTDTLPGRPIRNGPLKTWPSPRSPARVDGDPGVSTCPVVQPPRPPTAHNHSGALLGGGGRTGWHATLQLRSPHPDHHQAPSPGEQGQSATQASHLTGPCHLLCGRHNGLVPLGACSSSQRRRRPRERGEAGMPGGGEGKQGQIPGPRATCTYVYESVPRESWAWAPEGPQRYP